MSTVCFGDRLDEWGAVAVVELFLALRGSLKVADRIDDEREHASLPR